MLLLRFGLPMRMGNKGVKISWLEVFLVNFPEDFGKVLIVVELVD